MPATTLAFGPWGHAPKPEDGAPAGEKESTCRLQGNTRVANLSEQIETTRLVYAADREPDMLELMVRARQRTCAPFYLLRSQHDRVSLPRGGKLWAQVLQAPAREN